MRSSDGITFNELSVPTTQILQSTVHAMTISVFPSFAVVIKTAKRITSFYVRQLC